MILGVKQLNKIVKLYYFYTLKSLWDGQGKIKMYYGMPRVKKQGVGKKVYCELVCYIQFIIDMAFIEKLKLGFNHHFYLNNTQLKNIRVTVL